MTFTFTAGPGDRLVLPPNEFNGDAIEAFVFNQENRAERRRRPMDKLIQRSCVTAGVSPVGAVLPGQCAAAPDGDLLACLDARGACRFCLAVNVTAAPVPAIDCDAFDDGTSNASCP